MPNYYLTCPACNHEWQESMSMSDRENAKCPKCEAKAETNWSSGGSVLISGKGFYQERKLR